MDGDGLNLISLEAYMDESSGRRKFCLIPEEKIREYEKRMLCGSGCPYTLPMHFLTEDGSEKAFYDFTGFIQLAEYIKRSAAPSKPETEKQRPVRGALDILAGILGCLRGMESYLLFPERISLHPGIIFTNPDNGRAAFAFYPNDKPEEGLQKRIVALIGEMDGMYCDEEAGLYFNKFKDFIHMKNPGLDGMIAMLGTMQREISYIYWNSGDFRKKEEKETYSTYEKTVEIQSGGHDVPFGKHMDRNEKISGMFRRRPAIKAAAVQVIFGTGLAAVFLSGALDIVNFAGLAVIAAGVDLWLIRKLGYIK